ncbi:peptidase [Actinoplanes sp. SE50]|uniref:M28 family peptidase n=1 Tax=unclassified Actinoplanes TaxID=2626549 RepID=UPI00023ECFA6|nr:MULTISPECIES: M28 family peptidase [unclassified Actinoplanes]AEV81594.1 Endoplasmic reticulum metallopeptidase 1 [Actinoplanes sp. SE50/110]ATO79995.1 peptidase [Actinoplanes sp. SE50]SLL97399.1 peptidase [Actinoplanes sp. SE50/110]
MRDAALLRPARRGFAALAVLAVLALGGFAAVRSILPPAAAPASAPGGEFSAERAFQSVRTIAAAPHPAGSAANDTVRDHLLRTLRGLGLSPQVQDTVTAQGGELSASAGGTGLARVRNVVTLIPGSASTGRVFLVAHYDSAQTGPGGNDDAAGTASLLEIARALTTGPKLRNDVVLVMTDAEEACLCGAEAFVRQNPLAAGGGVVINLEARGSSGPAIMFETSARNARLVDAYAHTPDPVGTSFAVEIYRLLPNDTDFTAFREAGFTGLNSAYIDGAAVYHAPTDLPAAMDRDSLQHHGANALALTRTLGDTDRLAAATRAGGDATYFPALGLLVRYPGGLVWPLAGLAVLAVAALAWRARRTGRLTGRRLALAGLLTLAPIVVAPVLAQLFWTVLTLIRPEYGALPIDPYRPGLYRIAVIAIAAAVVFCWFALLRRRLGAAALAVAGLGWLAGLGVVLAAVTPGGAYLATLPALAGALTGLLTPHVRPWAGAAVSTLSGLVAVVILLPTVVMLFPALGMAMGAAGAFLTVLMLLALLPVIDLIHPSAEPVQGLPAGRARRRGALATLVASLTALACTAAGLAVDRFDAAHPSLTQLMYALDTDTGRAQWLSAEAKTQDWTAQYVSGAPKAVATTLPAFGAEELRTGPAPAASLPAPALTVESDTPSPDGGRVLKLLLKPQRTVRFTTLHVAAAHQVTAATVAGQQVPVGRAAGGGWGFGFIFHAPPAEGVEVVLTVRGTGPVKLRAMDASDNVTEMPGFHARPSGVGVLGSHSSEMVAVAKTYQF